MLGTGVEVGVRVDVDVGVREKVAVSDGTSVDVLEATADEVKVEVLAEVNVSTEVVVTTGVCVEVIVGDGVTGVGVVGATLTALREKDDKTKIAKPITLLNKWTWRMLCPPWCERIVTPSYWILPASVYRQLYAIPESILYCEFATWLLPA